jgi:hypothetical protein
MISSSGIGNQSGNLIRGSAIDGNWRTHDSWRTDLYIEPSRDYSDERMFDNLASPMSDPVQNLAISALVERSNLREK